MRVPEKHRASSISVIAVNASHKKGTKVRYGKFFTDTTTNVNFIFNLVQECCKKLVNLRDGLNTCLYHSVSSVEIDS